MNFLEFVKGNNEGLLTIDKMRSVLKDFCHERIKDNEESATEEDIDKLSLMIEYNFCVSTRKTFEIKAIDTDALAEYQDE